MSRAFVKESDGDTPGDLPDLPLSPHPNYVTPEGLAHMRELLDQARSAEERLRGAKDGEVLLAQQQRDIRWLRARIGAAIPTELPPGTPQIGFGAHVTLADDDGAEHAYRIVGEDEADPARGRISWNSPLARALTGAREGEVVRWPRPAGDVNVEVLAFRYDKPARA